MQDSSAMPPTGGWWVYIARCADGSLYTGITTDLDRRLGQHNAGTASKYTRCRRPVVLVYREHYPTRGHALAREAAIKALSRQSKEALVGTEPGWESGGGHAA